MITWPVFSPSVHVQPATQPQPQLRFRIICLSNGSKSIIQRFVPIRSLYCNRKTVHRMMDVFLTNEEISAAFEVHRSLNLNWPTVDVLEVDGADISMLNKLRLEN